MSSSTAPNDAASAEAPHAISPLDARPGRMPHPEYVDAKRVHWFYLGPIAAVHLLAILACFPWFFSWTGLVVSIIGVHFFGQGVNICYHRLLTHRSFAVPRWLERIWTVIAICNLEDTPAKWVSTHRLHHLSSDTRPDPHSPLVSFFWSHVGWLFYHSNNRRNTAIYHRYAHDILQDPFYMALEKSHLMHVYIYLAHMVLFYLAGFGIGWGLWGLPEANQFGMSLLVWGVFVRTVIVWHITWSVNSLSHLFGYKSYDTGEESKNNWFVALVTVGEGWHNNHHHDQASASNQHRWWEIDVSYYEIKILEWLGLAYNVLPPRHKRESAKRRDKVQKRDGVQSEGAERNVADPNEANSN